MALLCFRNTIYTHGFFKNKTKGGGGKLLFFIRVVCVMRRVKELLEGEVKICIFLKTNQKNKAKYDTYSYLHPKHGIINCICSIVSVFVREKKIK